MGSGYHELYKESVENPGGFWSGVASELHWHKGWRSAIDGAAPFFRWFAGGETNITYNALERHPSDRLAFVWAGSDGRVERYTYGEALERVRRHVCLLRGAWCG